MPRLRCGTYGDAGAGLTAYGAVVWLAIDMNASIGSRLRTLVADDFRAVQGVLGGGIRSKVACSKAYASAINRGSLQASPAKDTPNGAGCGSKFSGNAGPASFGTKPMGTMTVG